jgi:uncharacterized protein YaaN involved in tellurite resistance
MGGPPQPGEDQEVTVDITGPEEGASEEEKATFKRNFEQWKKDIEELRKKYAKLKIKVSKIAYKKKKPDESF